MRHNVQKPNNHPLKEKLHHFILSHFILSFHISLHPGSHNYEIFAPNSSRETTDRCEARTRWTLLIVQPALLVYATTSQRDAKSYFKTSSKSK